MSIEEREVTKRRAGGPLILSVVCGFAGALAMLWPAIYNRFPMLYPDSMTYLADGSTVARAVFLHQLSDYYGMRSFIYSLGILPLHWTRNPWPIVILNALLTAWVVWLVVRSIVPRRTAIAYLLLVLPVSLLTSLSWYVSLVMPDILGPLLYLSVYLLVFARESLSRLDRIALYPLVWWAIASHTTHLLLVSGLCVLLLPLAFARSGRREQRRALGEIAICIVLAACSHLALHKYLYGEASLNGERPPFLTARIIADGPGRRYLEEHCVEKTWVICSHVHNLTDDVDNFLWAPDGIWQTASPDDRKLLVQQESAFVAATFRAYPLQQTERSLFNFWHQLLDFGLDDLDPSTYVLDDFATTMPAAKPHYLASRQVRDEMPLDRFTSIQNVTVAVSLAIVAGLLLLAWRNRRTLLLELSFVIIAMVLANAFVTGAMSMVDPRFESRVIWLIPVSGGARDTRCVRAALVPQRCCARLIDTMETTQAAVLNTVSTRERLGAHLAIARLDHSIKKSLRPSRRHHSHQRRSRAAHAIACVAAASRAGPRSP